MCMHMVRRTRLASSSATFSFPWLARRSLAWRTCNPILGVNRSGRRFFLNLFVAARFRMGALLWGNARTEASKMAVTGFGEIAEKLRRSTVLVQTGSRGNGSGVIWSSDGTIITNAHVVRSSQIRIQLWDGREFQATVGSRDPQRDL